MALRSLSVITFTPTATADTANLADTTYIAIQGGTSTQRIRVEDVYMGGQAGASAPTLMLLSRDSTVGATLSLGSGCTDAALDPATAALAAAPATFNTATTKPQRSSTLHLWPFNFNAFGGLVRINLSPNERELALLGNTASLGELSMSAYSGGTPGAMSGMLIYEAFVGLLAVAATLLSVLC
jgi:hypothetical protein